MTKEISAHICKVCGEEFIPTDSRKTARCKSIHELPCNQCGEIFELKPNDKADRRYCSRKCSAASKSKPRLCKICGNLIEGRSASATTCSSECTRALRNQTVLSQEKECEWCKKKFNGLSTTKYCDREHTKECEVCSKTFKVNPYGPRRTCSNLCNGKLVNNPESNAKRRDTSRKNWGTDFPQQSDEVKGKIRESNIEAFGYTSPLASPEHREKARKTSLEKYGVEWYTQSEEGKEARANTNEERYGARNPFASEEIKEKIRAVWREKYGVDHPMQNPEVVEGGKSTNLRKYGVPNVLMVPEFQEKARETFAKNLNDGKFTSRKVSKINLRLAELLEKEFKLRPYLEQSFGPFQADLSLGNILIDIHPTVSHNSEVAFACLIKGCSLPCEKHTPIARDYHFKRAVAARDADRTLVQWYGWESDEKLVEYLRGKVEQGFKKYSARQLSRVTLDSKSANEFLGQYHVQGAGRGQSHLYGLKTPGGDLVAVATFGKSRFGASESWEFIRYAVKRGVVVHGGANILFKEFKKDASPDSVVSYVDFSHTTRKTTFLSSLGFVESKLTGPALTWHNLVDDRVVRHTSLLAVGADRLLGTSYGSREVSGLDNTGIMLLEGFLPVWTAGNRVFKWSQRAGA